MKSVAKLDVQDTRKEETAHLSLPLDEYVGTYSAPDYGNVTFCSRTLSGDSERDDEDCQSLRDAFDIVDAAEGRTSSGSPELIASWPRFWLKQLRLTHLTRDVFRIFGTALFTEGYGADTTPFAYKRFGTERAIARFIIGRTDEDGGTKRVAGFFACGLLRDAESAQGDCVTGEGAEPGSLVWFAKV